MKNKNASPDSMFHKMVLIANLYYKEKLSQQEIAQRLNLSRPWVSKLLTRAEEVGIVKIEVISPFEGNEALESALREKYGMQYVRVISAGGAQDVLAAAAAQYFIAELRSRDVVGVGWGTSVSRLIAQTEPCSYPDVQVVPLAGSFGNTISHFPNFSALRLSEALHAAARVLHTPARCASADEYRTLMSNSTTQEILHLAEHANILLLGIGAFADSVSPQYGVFSPDEIAALREKEAVGDVALQYLNKEGQPIDIEATRHLIKADIFKASANARISIGIAEGLHKAATIDAALRLKLVNSLFTSEETALALLSY